MAFCLFFRWLLQRHAVFRCYLFNTLIGIVQELRVKHELEKISLLHVATVTAVRNGQRMDLPAEQLVRDDIVFSAGRQPGARRRTGLRGRPEVNEALLTGEAASVQKQLGDDLMSGSFLVAGTCLARVLPVSEKKPMPLSWYAKPKSPHDTVPK